LTLLGLLDPLVVIVHAFIQVLSPLGDLFCEKAVDVLPGRGLVRDVGACGADRRLRAAGLDPYVGFLHEATRGNPVCALDLMEEWRPLVDALVFGLVNRRSWGPRTPRRRA
jgi:hypothetical protein